AQVESVCPGVVSC
nr:RecName: Full=Peroxidase 6 [Cycas revoluta]